MKKLLLFAAAATMLAACSKDTTKDIALLPNDKLYAKIESAESRVCLTDGNKASWENYDNILLFYGNVAAERWQYNNFQSETDGYFTKMADGKAVQYTYDKLIALHGPNISSSDAGDFHVRLSQIQSYNKISPMMAVEPLGSNNLLFKNLIGFIRISLCGNKSVDRITLKGNNGETVCGMLTVNYKTLECHTTENRTECTLRCWDLVQLSETEPTTFDIAVIPQTFEKGFSITVKFSDDTTLEKSTDKAITVERNHIVPMKELEYNSLPNNEIWYTSTNRKIVKPYATDVFGANIISNTYENGKGIIKFDAPVTQIGDYAFLYCYNLKSITIPDEITEISALAFYYCSNLCSFYGKFSSTDNRCLIANGELIAFAKAGLTEYTVPGRVVTIGKNAFIQCDALTSIKLPISLRTIKKGAFSWCSKLKSIDIPLWVETIELQAFQGCNSLEKFCGNRDFVSEDNLCLTAGADGKSDKTAISAFATGSKQTSYTIPNGISSILFGAFMDNQYIQSITLPNTITKIDPYAFLRCNNLEYIYGNYASSDNKCAVIDGVAMLFAGKGLKEYTTPNDVKYIGEESFAYKDELENLIISDNVTEIDGFAFVNCPNLKNITISANTKVIAADPFEGNTKLTNVFCRALTPPELNYIYQTEFDNLTIYVPKQSLNTYLNRSDWQPYKQYIKGYEYTDLPASDKYVSSDYSADGKVEILQKATVGNGIDIVLMGDAFSDRQIAAGDYDTAMRQAADNLFTEEPYKSFRNMFNVYAVTAVSATEGYEHENTAFSGYFGDGTIVGGNDAKVFEYAQKAIAAERMDDALIVVMMNSQAYAGTCYMYYPSSNSDYGRGVSVAYFPLGTDNDMFAQLLHHEACGHGFAKLADEYAYEYMGAVPTDYVSQVRNWQSDWGWYKNVDFTSDPATVKWHTFLSDPRYANEGLGVFEGGATYWTGVWRPTENSIMRYNTGGFNAPSREAIYYRIHKLAYGESWNYDYEDFVAYDAVNRKASAGISFSTPIVPKDFVPLAPPVVVGKSWRDAR